MSAICVYSSSSRAVHPRYFAAAQELGTAIGRRGHSLVFGGTDIGLMGALAHAARAAGAAVTGVVPELARGSSYVYAADEVIYTADLRSRKQEMERRADAFMALPGGFGTLDELLEVITLKQLKLHAKPVVILDQHNYYAPLLQLFEHLYAENFASAAQHRQLYGVAADVDAAFGYIEQYHPPELNLLWS